MTKYILTEEDVGHLIPIGSGKYDKDKQRLFKALHFCDGSHKSLKRIATLSKRIKW